MVHAPRSGALLRTLGQTVCVAFPEDPGVLSVMRTFAVTADDLLGHGGEAWVLSLIHI